ncbi:hypothetical protein Celaphus_00004550 [Cervus elaphus hippelaphus]|uniref:DH domain-containing protein n=1 Tax=Cervus elaphus hippelaphus TaxID=46360 RepID=A0A212DC12_CEREH|nr:hypothetical protein Celaphus_00004550 [Cervus elaphus hippelaphus]
MEAEDVARGAAPGPPRPGLVPVSIIGAEDEDFEIELKTNPEEQNNQFQNLDQLCCLHADMLGSLGPKEFKKAFIDFYHSFLDKHSILRVMVPPPVAFELDRTRPDLFSEDLQRQFVQEVVQSQQVAVVRQLEDFRSKKLMGMTPWEQELAQLGAWVARDRASYEARERHLAERQLTHLEEMQHTISNDEEKSAAVVNAISLYMRHLGVRTKSGDKKSGRNFFRKKMIGNRRSDEPTKTKKGLSSFLDAARWNRGEPQAPDFRHLKVEVDAEKPGLTERKGGQGAPSRDRNLGGPGQDTPGVSLHPLSGDSPDREPELLVTEAAHVRMLRVLHELFYQPMADGGYFSQQELQTIFPSLDELIEVHSLCSVALPLTPGSLWLSGRLGRSESLRVSDRRRPSRGSLGAKGRGGGRSRSDVDMDPSSATAVLGPARRATPEPGDEGEPGRSGLELEPEEPPGWRELVPQDILHNLPRSQVKRQEVISEVHVLLLDDLLLLLQRQDDRFLLKSHSRTLTPTPDGKTMLRPVLRLTSAMTREVATDHKAFYVIFTWDHEAQIYELVAQTVSERRIWCTIITETAGCLKVPAPTSRPKHRPSPSSTREPLLSSSENGNGSREMPPVDGRMERLFNSLLPFCRQGLEGQLAAKALQKVLTLKQLLLPSEEDSGAGPPLEGDGVPGGGPSSPTQHQEIREKLLSLEETIKQLEVVWPGGGSGEEGAD